MVRIVKRYRQDSVGGFAPQHIHDVLLDLGRAPNYTADPMYADLAFAARKPRKSRLHVARGVVLNPFAAFWISKIRWRFRGSGQSSLRHSPGHVSPLKAKFSIRILRPRSMCRLQGNSIKR